MKTFIKDHKFGITLFFALLSGALLIRLSGGCPIYRLTHIECMFCGMFHACLAAMRFDFSKAFHSHPMFWSVPILAVFVIFEGKLFKKKIVNIIILSIIAAGFLICYMMKYGSVVLHYIRQFILILE